MIYYGINQLISKDNSHKKIDAIKAAEKAYLIGCSITYILCKTLDTIGNYNTRQPKNLMPIEFL